jgi:serine/threonine-protein kinase
MGEVYRAIDTRLERSVALKVLPEHLLDDPTRLERLEREARAISSLSHPNICTLYDIGEAAGVRYLVMELVEGDTLAKRLEKGRLPLEEALEHACRIADALDKAHRQGIVHRDLKPGNVILAKSGVKLLDFGLAKLQTKATSESLLSEEVTAERSEPLTVSGTIVGTLQYMAPEQVEGQEVDSRADIFALGCVIYEMITGRRAFSGGSPASVIGAILKDEPPPMAELQGLTPASLEHVVRRCLAKDPDERWQSAGDVMRELRWAAELEVPDAPSPRRRVPWLMAALGVLIAASAVAFLAGSLRTPPPNAVTRALMDVEPGEWLGSTSNAKWTHESSRLSRTALALSPDGRYLVFSAGDDTGSRLYLRAMDETRATPIAGTDGALTPFFSPDGEWIGFWSGHRQGPRSTDLAVARQELRRAEGELRKVRGEGGPSMAVGDVPTHPIGGSWGADGTIVVGTAVTGILRGPADGGGLEEITVLEDDRSQHLHPQLLDDGNTLLFTSRRNGDWEDTRIVAQSLDTGERTVLIENGADARYVPTGHLVFLRLGTLMAVPFDPKRLEVTGSEVVVLESVRQGVNASNGNFHTYSGQFTFSSSGTLVHVPGGIWPDQQSSLVWVDRTGRSEPLTTLPGRFHGPRLSPDGTRVTMFKAGFEPSDIWIYEIARGTLSRLTVGEGRELRPAWTPDGACVTFESVDSDGSGISWIAADGSGRAEILSTIGAAPASWTPDGQVLAFLQPDEAGGRDIWMLPLKGEPWPFIESAFKDQYPTFSPDGRWLAYASGRSGRSEIYVTPYPGPGPRVQISTDGGIEPAWAPSGRELFFRELPSGDPLLAMWAVEITTEPSFRASTPRELFRRRQNATLPLRNYDVASDGQRFLMLERANPPVTRGPPLHVTLNWFEELKRLAPAD